MSHSLPSADFDLNQHFLPAWAKRPPDARAPGEVGDFEREQPRKKSGRGDRDRDRRGGRERDRGDRDRRERDRERPRTGRTGPKPPPKEAPTPLPEIDVNFVADDKGIDSIARQIKITGRAYPLFEIAQMILQKPERHWVRFSVVKGSDGSVAQPLYRCALDDSLWLSHEEAVRYALDHYFDTFYQAEKIPASPPKGTFTFVAQCGMTGTILGPPNYHDYQNQLRRLHQRKFPDMPFETFKSRIKIIRDPEVVNQWIEDQSYRTEYVCLNVSESRRLYSREEVEQHFREVHAPTVVQSVASYALSGPASRKLSVQPLQRLARKAWEDQKRFPLKVVHRLSQQLASRGLQFFKVNKTVTHVSVARPRYLDIRTTPVTEGVRKIVEFIEATPQCNRRRLLEALAPAPTLPVPGGGQPETQEGGTAEGQAAEIPEPTPEQKRVIADLHWLIHEGHVIEFANGILENAKPSASKQHRSENVAVGPGPEKKKKKKPQETGGPSKAAKTEAGESGTPARSGSDVGERPEGSGLGQQSGSSEAKEAASSGSMGVSIGERLQKEASEPETPPSSGELGPRSSEKTTPPEEAERAEPSDLPEAAAGSERLEMDAGSDGADPLTSTDEGKREGDGETFAESSATAGTEPSTEAPHDSKELTARSDEGPMGEDSPEDTRHEGTEAPVENR